MDFSPTEHEVTDLAEADEQWSGLGLLLAAYDSCGAPPVLRTILMRELQKEEQEEHWLELADRLGRHISDDYLQREEFRTMAEAHLVEQQAKNEARRKQEAEEECLREEAARRHAATVIQAAERGRKSRKIAAKIQHQRRHDEADPDAKLRDVRETLLQESETANEPLEAPPKKASTPEPEPEPEPEPPKKLVPMPEGKTVDQIQKLYESLGGRSLTQMLFRQRCREVSSQWESPC